jgi:hypothetical protein
MTQSHPFNFRGGMTQMTVVTQNCNLVTSLIALHEIEQTFGARIAE